MTRDELIEKMARDMMASYAAQKNLPLPNSELKEALAFAQDNLAAIIAETLTAIEAAGLCIVPREIADAQFNAAMEVTYANPPELYKAMIEAGRI